MLSSSSSSSCPCSSFPFIEEQEELRVVQVKDSVNVAVDRERGRSFQRSCAFKKTPLQ